MRIFVGIIRFWASFMILLVSRVGGKNIFVHFSPKMIKFSLKISKKFHFFTKISQFSRKKVPILIFFPPKMTTFSLKIFIFFPKIFIFSRRQLKKPRIPTKIRRFPKHFSRSLLRQKCQCLVRLQPENWKAQLGFLPFHSNSTIYSMLLCTR